MSKQRSQALQASREKVRAGSLSVVGLSSQEFYDVEKQANWVDRVTAMKQSVRVSYNIWSNSLGRGV